MIVTNATPTDLYKAMDALAPLYGGNVRFNEMTALSPRRVRFTLKVLDSAGPGGRRNLSPFRAGQRVQGACWHVHGDFFEALLAVRPDAVIRSRRYGKATISAEGGNWDDLNGQSKACGCDR